MPRNSRKAALRQAQDKPSREGFEVGVLERGKLYNLGLTRDGLCFSISRLSNAPEAIVHDHLHLSLATVVHSR
jgi:hypothetical protein